MSTVAERIRDHHRYSNVAAPVVASRLGSLTHHGLSYQHLDDVTVQVEGDFIFHLVGGNWRSTSDPSCKGYLVLGMLKEIARRKAATNTPARSSAPVHEKPAGGRDSAPDTPLDPHTPVSESAESPAGARSSINLLPEVSL